LTGSSDAVDRAAMCIQSKFVSKIRSTTVVIDRIGLYVVAICRQFRRALNADNDYVAHIFYFTLLLIISQRARAYIRSLDCSTVYPFSYQVFTFFSSCFKFHLDYIISFDRVILRSKHLFKRDELMTSRTNNSADSTATF
jgi:hypothetical protein